MTFINCYNADCKYFNERLRSCDKEEIEVDTDLHCADFDFKEEPSFFEVPEED